MPICLNCGNETPKYHNHCNWECHIELAKKSGGKVHTPNNLPIKCITGGNLMLEHSHGDHPDYKFPIEAMYVGDLSIFNEKDDLGNEVACDKLGLAIQTSEVHALIYADECIALSIYEACYYMWHLVSGLRLDSHNWRLTDESLEKIRGRYAANNGERNV